MSKDVKRMSLEEAESFTSDQVTSAIKSCMSGRFSFSTPRTKQSIEEASSRDSTEDNDALSHNYGQYTAIYYRTTSIGEPSDICTDCGASPQDVRHLFACTTHPTDLSPEDLWPNPVGSIRAFSYLDNGNLD